MASSSSRLCSDEELQKAREDWERFRAQFSAGYDELSSSSDDEDEEEKEKKKVTKEMVDKFINFKLSENKSEEAVMRRSKIRSGEYGTLARVGDVLSRHYQDRIRALQDKLRHKVETDGYKGIVDEEEQEADAPAVSCTAIDAARDGCQESK